MRGIARRDLPARPLTLGVYAFIFLTTWLAAIVNPSVLDLIETLSGPVIAALLYLMPMYAISKVPALAPYRGQASNVFIVISGLVAISAIVFKIVA